MPLHELKPSPGNPRKHPERQLAVYAKVMSAHGWRRPVIVSRRSGRIVCGEGAVLAARRLGLIEAPVEFQDYESDEAERAALLADNRVFELGKTEGDALKLMLAEISAEAVTGYSSEEIASLVREVAALPQYPITARLHEKHDYLLIYCDSATDFQFLKQLAGVRMERSYKNSTVGEGRAVAFSDFLLSLRENLHSIAPQGSHDDDTAPGA